MQEVVEHVAGTVEFDGSPKTPATPMRPTMKAGELQFRDEVLRASRNANASTGHLSERIQQKSRASQEPEQAVLFRSCTPEGHESREDKKSTIASHKQTVIKKLVQNCVQGT